MVNPEKLKKAELIDELAKNGIPLPTPTSKYLKAVFVDLYKTHITNGSSNVLIKGTTDSNNDLDFDKLSDNEIKNMLELRGVSVGPVTGSTRQVYIKKLQKLLSEETLNPQSNIKQEDESEAMPVVMLQSTEIPIATRETRSASRRRTMLLSSQKPVLDNGVDQNSSKVESLAEAAITDKTVEISHTAAFSNHVASAQNDFRQRSVSVEPKVVPTTLQNHELLVNNGSIENEHSLRQRSVKPETFDEISVTENSMMTDPEEETSTLPIKNDTKKAKCSVYLKVSITVVVAVLVVLCLQMKFESKDIEHFFKDIQHSFYFKTFQWPYSVVMQPVS